MTSDSSDIIDKLATIRDYIRWAASHFNEAGLFFGHGTDNALDEACFLVLHTLHQPYHLSTDYFDAVLTDVERMALFNIITRRVEEKIPAVYLTHEAIFAGLSFYVDERVLIPRSPIAELIEAHFSPWVDSERVKNVLDLCTGSGCIAIGCACAFPDAQIDALDFSGDALEVAAINRERHHLQEQIHLIHSDLFSALPEKKYDIIVSNPPYVARPEWRQLPEEYFAEPEIGFDGGQDGLDLVIKILAQANSYLDSHGILVVEVGSSAETLQTRFPSVPFFWLDFERGGDGVFLLTAQQVQQNTPIFQAA